MKKTQIISSIASLSTITLLLSPSAFAQYGTAAVPTARTTAQTANQTTRITNIKTRADKEIEFRLTSLNDALSRISNAKKLSADDKTKFTGEIQTDITALTNLKTKIDADTDLTTLITDAKTIFTDYRVYAIFLPQVHMLSAIDIIGVTADNLATVSGKLQTRIQTTQSQGKDVTNLNTLLSDMNAKIADSKTQAQAAEAEIVSLTPSNFPATSTLQDARSKIKTASQDLKTARNDALQILQGLHALNGGGETSTGAADILKTR